MKIRSKIFKGLWLLFFFLVIPLSLLGLKDLGYLPLSGGIMSGQILQPQSNCLPAGYGFISASNYGFDFLSGVGPSGCYNTAPYSLTRSLGKNRTGNQGTPFSSVFLGGGSSLVPGDFSISAGWGTTASVSAVSGTDSRFSVTVLSGGTGQATGASITLTFHDGTFTARPYANCVIAGGTGAFGPISPVLIDGNQTATTLQIYNANLPVNGLTYIYTCHVIG